MSPEAWADARFRVETAALGIPIEWPNEPWEQPDASSGPWLYVEGTADVSMPMELGQDADWIEQGRIFLHLYAPIGSGSDEIRVFAKRLANQFRGLGPGAIRYTSASIGSGEIDDSNGSWWRLTVWVTYKFQDSPSA